MATPSSALEGNFDDLIAAIQSRNCVLVLGPRIAVPSELHAESISIDDFLCERLLKDIGNGERVDLREAIARYEKQKSPAHCRAAVKSAGVKLDQYTTELHRNLASLPFRLVLCATPDRMMANAFRERGRSGVQEAYYDFCGTSAGSVLLREPATDNPIVYSLFGRCDHPESMVLNENNLLDYLVRVTKLAPPIPDQVRAILTQPSTLFMFIGFGFANWWLRFLLKVLDVIGVANRAVSHALEGPVVNTDLSADNRDFFASAGIDIHADDWNAIAKDLAERFHQQESARNALPPASESPAGAKSSGTPLVFLSYSGKDREKVDSLRTGLQQRGVSVWQDHHNLQAGQDWQVRIAQVIHRCDYFIFVQTPNVITSMKHGDDGWYNWELTCALERKKLKPSHYGFVIPVTIGSCAPLPDELATIHCIPVDDDAGVERLAQAVLTSYGALSDSPPSPQVA